MSMYNEGSIKNALGSTYRDKDAAQRVYTGIGTAAQCATPNEYSEIETRLRHLESELDELRSVTAVFCVRLQTVLVPQAATNGCATATSMPTVSPLSERLDAICAGFRHERAILRDVFERIAL